jgi:hypothetical protein
MKYVLLEYTYLSDCQGTTDRCTGYALLKVPVSYNSLEDYIQVLRHHKQNDVYHNIQSDTVEDLTIEIY